MPDWAVRATFGAVDKLSTVLSHMGVNMGKFGESMHGAMAMAEKGSGIFKSMLGANLVADALKRIGHEIIQLPKLLGDFAERGEALGRTAQIIGTTAENWQRLAFAAKMTDISADSLQGAMQKLNRNMADLTVGKGTLMDIMKFGPRGLAQAIRGTHDTTEAFMLLSDAMVKTRDPQVRARMAVAAFGKAGQEMIPMLLKGRVELERLRALAPDVIPKNAIDAAGQYSDNFKLLKANVEGVKNQVLGFVLKALTPYLEKAVIWLQANKEIVATRIETFISRVGTAIQNAKPFLLFLWDAAGWLIKNWPMLALVYLYWTAAQIALNVALDANPIGAVIIAIMALVVAVIFVIHYWKEITGAIHDAWDWFDRLYNKSLLLRTALFFLASPIWLVVEAIRTLVDLLSGRGLKSFQNFIPPWLKGATDKLGISGQDANQGYWNNAEAPNKGMGAMQVVNNVNVDNSRAPGVTSNVRTSQAAQGNPGPQFAMGTP